MKRNRLAMFKPQISLRSLKREAEENVNTFAEDPETSNLEPPKKKRKLDDDDDEEEEEEEEEEELDILGGRDETPEPDQDDDHHSLLDIDDLRIGSQGAANIPMTQAPETYFSQVNGVGDYAQDQMYSLHHERDITPRTPTTPSLNTVKLENLIFLDLLGQGASSKVWKVKDKITKIVYAMKVIQLKKRRGEGEKMVFQEVKTLFKCHSCPYIVQFVDCFYFKKRNEVNLLLEYVQYSLEDVIDKYPRGLPLKEIAAIAVMILKGLKYLKQLKILHRDIKPGNILIHKEGLAKISDLGLAGYKSQLNKNNVTVGDNDDDEAGVDIFDEENSKDTFCQPVDKKELFSHPVDNNNMFFKTMQGTILYMAPERIDGKPHSWNSDIWSFGMTMLECRCGEFPFPLGKIDFFSVREEVRKIEGSSKWKDLRREFNIESDSFLDFIRKCLRCNPKDRPSPTELLKHPFLSEYIKKIEDVQSILKGFVVKLDHSEEKWEKEKKRRRRIERRIEKNKNKKKKKKKSSGNKSEEKKVVDEDEHDDEK